MSEQKFSKDLRTKAIVLKRTNYGEADRILTLITPEGKKSVLARAVRREKSRLAGGIEMFSVSEVVIHQGKGDLAILTAARSEQFFKQILTELERVEAAGEILKQIAKVAENVENAEYFSLAEQSLAALDNGKDIKLILTWFYFNLARTSGEQINLTLDTEGKELVQDGKYSWDISEKALKLEPAGKIAVNEIKVMRLMLAARLELVLMVKEAMEMAPELLYIAKTLNQV